MSPRTNARTRPLSGRALLSRVLLVLAVCSSVPSPHAQPVPPPPPPDPFWQSLEQQRVLAPLPPGSPVLYLVYRLGQAPPRVLLRPNPGHHLPKTETVAPEASLTEPGFYVGVTVPGTPPKLAYLVRLADPRFVVGETATQGKLEGKIVKQPGGVLATRVPFVPDGTLVIYEIDGTLAHKLHVLESLGHTFPPAAGHVVRTGAP